MRMRIIAVAVVVGLGIVGISLAQQAGEGRGNDRAKLRAQVARLRAEVELRQMEHDVDADMLKRLMTDMRNLEGLASLKGPAEELLKSGAVPKAVGVRGGLPGFEAFQKQAQEEAKAEMQQEAKAEMQLDELTAKWVVLSSIASRRNSS